jgi:hypothetical protein
VGLKENQEHKKSYFRYTEPLIISGRFSYRLVDMKVQFPEFVLFQNCTISVLLTVVI